LAEPSGHLDASKVRAFQGCFTADVPALVQPGPENGPTAFKYGLACCRPNDVHCLCDRVHFESNILVIL
jgi:hypothetical protein